MLCWIENHPGLAAWIQAVGVIFAFGASVCVPARQHRKVVRLEKENEKRQVRNILQAVLDELDTLWSGYQETIGNTIGDLKDGEYLRKQWPVRDSPFDVWTAVAQHIGRIPNGEVRHLIVLTYARANGLVSSIRFNNSMLQNLDEARWYHESNPADQVGNSKVSAYADSMITYAKLLKGRHLMVASLVDRTRNAIRDELTQMMPRSDPRES